MNRLLLHPRCWYRAPLWARVLLFAFVVHALVPVGYMPAARATGGLPISLCTQGMPSGFTPSQAPDPASFSHSALQHCVFGSASSVPALLSPPAGVPAVVLAVLGRVQPLLAPGVNHHAICGPPLGPRAPPSFCLSSI